MGVLIHFNKNCLFSLFLQCNYKTLINNNMSREKEIIKNGEMSSWDKFKLKWDRESYFKWIKYSITVE